MKTYKYRYKSPLTIRQAEQGQDYSYFTDLPLISGKEYQNEVQDAINSSFTGLAKEAGLAFFYAGSPVIKKKLLSIFPSVADQDGKLISITTLETSAPLSKQELDDVEDFIEGHYSSGWGEGFEQREISVDGGKPLFVHFWFAETFEMTLVQNDSEKIYYLPEISSGILLASRNKSNPGYKPLPLPASDMELLDFCERENIQDASAAFVFLESHQLSYLENVENNYLEDSCTLLQANLLAKRLDQMNEDEHIILSAMMDDEDNPPDYNRLIDLAFATGDLECYTHDSYDQLGEYMLEREEYAHLKAAGIEYIDLERVAFDAIDNFNTILNNDDHFVFWKNGYSSDTVKHHVPREDERTLSLTQPEWEFKLFLKNPFVLSIPGINLCLPATRKEEMDSAKLLELLYIHSAVFTKFDSSYPQINAILTGTESIVELNDLAESLQSLRKQGQTNQIKAVMETQLPITLQELQEISDTFDGQTVLTDVQTFSDYGRQVLEESLGVASDHPMLRHMNYHALGEEMMKINHITPTAYGFVVTEPERDPELLNDMIEPEL